MTGEWRGPLSASLRRRIRSRRLYRYAVPVISPYTEKLRVAAVGDHVCQRYVFRPYLGPWLPEHVCPACRVERADYEGPDRHLEKCPNCGSAAAPVPAGQPS